MGTTDIINQLEELHYTVNKYPGNEGFPGEFVSFIFKIPHGRFIGQEVEIALHAPDFPNIPPSGPYISPHLLPFKPYGSSHPFDGVHDRKVPNEKFQYWSRPFIGWNESGKSMKDYIGFLKTLFDF